MPVDVGEQCAAEAERHDNTGRVGTPDERLGPRRRVEQPVVEVPPGDQEEVCRPVRVLHAEEGPARRAIAREAVRRPAQRHHHLVGEAPQQPERERAEEADADAVGNDAAHGAASRFAFSRRQSAIREKYTSDVPRHPPTFVCWMTIGSTDLM